MPYIGKSPHFGVRNRFIYTASGSETSKSGADDNGATLTFTDGAYVDVYLNGVLLKPDTDYVTTTANTIGSLSALTASDILEVIVYDVFSVSDTVSAASGGTFQGAVGFNGDITVGDDIILNSDSSVIHFGADSDVTVTHDPDDGLILKSTATADDNPFLLTLQTGETDLAADDVIGKIAFQAPDEGTGTDAILVSAAIQARAEGNHSSSSNATSIDFMTGSSEAAVKKMSLSSAAQLSLFTGASSTEFGRLSLTDTNNLSIGCTSTDHVGITFGSTYLPRLNESNNDNGVDIGAASFRYKDLYLGGGIHLGGTGSANKLEDYEEGTWTPRLHGTTTGDGTAASRIDANGAYDYYKIGGLVFVNWYFSAQSTSTQMTGNLTLGGLPFTSNGTYMSGGSTTYNMGLPGNTNYYYLRGDTAGNTVITFNSPSDNAAWAAVDAADAVPNSTSIYFKGTLTYATDS